jgi:chemotaxis protein MotB
LLKINLHTIELLNIKTLILKILIKILTLAKINIYKMNRGLFLPIIIGMLLYSCVPIHKCGEAAPEKKPASRRLLMVLEERDSICNEASLKDRKISNLNSQVVEMTEINLELQTKYDNLLNTNVSQSKEFNDVLNAKSKELNEKEKLLYDREKALKEMRKIIAHQDSITNKLNDILKGALLGFNSDELSVEMRNGKVYVSMSDKLLFKSGSAAIENKGKEAIRLLADVLQKNADIEILIEGHTDNIPIKTAIYKDNWDLSVIRATSIVRILSEDYAIANSRITASGKGEFAPRADNETAEGRAKNRRTEIILSPKMDEVFKLLNSK